MRILHLIICSLIAVSCSAVTNNKLQNSDELESALVGYKMVNMNTGRTICALNENVSISPASVEKLVTTATALELLGKEFQFTTKLAYSGTIKRDTLFGNVYILGGGDPTLGSEKFEGQDPVQVWANTLLKLNIRHIKGSIISDASIFDNEPIPPSWNWQDMGNYYAAGTFGLSIYDNMTKVFFKTGSPGSLASITKVIPEITDLHIESRVEAANIKGDRAFFHGAPYTNFRYVNGQLPANTNDFLVKGDIPNPPLAAGYLLLNALEKCEISVEKGVSTLNDGAKTTTINTIVSPKLEDIIKVINNESNNLFAEHVFKSLALTIDQQASYDKAVKVTKEFWKSKGFNNDLLYIFDGSGLSDRNTITVNWLTQMLIYMTKSPNWNPFFYSLPLAGSEGTVKNFLTDSPLMGKVHLKTGSMERVQCYAGYIVDKNSKYAFAILINNFNGSRREVVKAVEKWMINAAQN